MTDPSTSQTIALDQENSLTGTLVYLADTLVADFDIIELLTVLTDRCVELFDASAAGILLADQNGKLRVMAASSETARLLELFQLQNDEGPCLECFLTGQQIQNNDLRVSNRWPLFSAEAINGGFHAVYALPMRLRKNVLGALNLFRNEAGALNNEDLRAVQSLADVASIAVLQDQANREAEVRTGQLQHALDSRVVIEQAKGILAESIHVDMAEAFSRLREFARNHNQGLTDVATDVVAGGPALSVLTKT